SSRITASGNSISCSLRLQWIQLILFPESSIKHYAWPSCCAVVVARRLLTPAWSQYHELCPDLCACLQKELTISSFSPIWWHSTPRACITATTSFPPPHSASPGTATYIWQKRNPAICWNRSEPSCITDVKAMQSVLKSRRTPIPKSLSACAPTSNWNLGRFFP